MKKAAIAILLAVAACAAPRLCAQENVAAGGLASAAYYLGDFSPSAPMYKPSLYVGGMVSYTISDYYSLRVNMGGGELRGDPLTYKGKLMSGSAGQMPTAFRRYFFDVDARIEVGFLPYDAFGFNPEKLACTPYFSLGAGLGYSGGSPYFQLPVGVGFKYRVYDRITLGAEWCFRKTFDDTLDGWVNIRTSDGGTSNNNDWISYAGVYITYQLADKILCQSLR